MNSFTTTTVNERRTRLRVAGDPAQPPILLLHGLGRSLEDWEPQYCRLTEYRTIAIDMPGFGFSARRPGPISLRVLAQAVADTLDTLGETRPLHVIGNSLGGAVALQMLTLQPQRVATLVLVDSAGFGSEMHPLLRLLATPIIGGLAARHSTRASALMTERLIFADSSLATRERIDHAMEIARQPGTGTVVHELSCVLSTSRGARPEWRNSLLAEASYHPRPTLIVWGDRDRLLPPTLFEAARKILPHAQHHLFSGVGHMPQIEAPDEFAELIRGFIQSSAEPRC
jgi:pimeloyl-ACP methyl ester carboxylesterase